MFTRFADPAFRKVARQSFSECEYMNTDNGSTHHPASVLSPAKSHHLASVLE
jgi:hypothetical protein